MCCFIAAAAAGYCCLPSSPCLQFSDAATGHVSLLRGRHVGSVFSPAVLCPW
jgi:hypothetical protein